MPYGALAGAATSAAGSGLVGIGTLLQESPKYRPIKPIRRNLDAVRKVAPEELYLSRAYGPQYLGLGLGQTEYGLFGDPGGMRQVQAYDERGKPVKNRYVNYDAPATPGFLDIIEAAQPRLDALYQDSASRDRAGMVRDLGLYAPQVAAAQRQAEPERFAYQDMLRRAGTEELGYGTQLSPYERRDIQQSIRAGQSARGLGMGPRDVYEESLALALGGNQRLRERQQFALNAGQLTTQMDRDPYMALYGARGQANAAPALASQMFGYGQGVMPNYSNQIFANMGYMSPPNNDFANALIAGGATLAGNSSSIGSAVGGLYGNSGGGGGYGDSFIAGYQGFA